MYSQVLWGPQRDVRADVPLHAAVEALQCMRAVKEPSRVLAYGVDNSLAAARPFGSLQTSHERLGQPLVEYLCGLDFQEPLRESYGEIGVLVLMAPSQAYRERSYSDERGMNQEVRTKLDF